MTCQSPQRYCLLLMSMNSETGAARRARLNWSPDVRIVGCSGDEAPETFRRRFKFMHTARPASRRGIVGCAWAHVMGLRKIIEEDLKHVVMLEDDALQVTDLPPVESLPTDQAVYLGGCLRTPGTWAAQGREFPESVEAQLWDSLRFGLNAVQGFSVVGLEALYVPNAEVAQRLLDYLDHDSLRMLNVDLFVRKHNLVKLIWFPNCFCAADATASQVEGRAQVRDLYAAGRRKIARRLAQLRARDGDHQARTTSPCDSAASPPTFTPRASYSSPLQNH